MLNAAIAIAIALWSTLGLFLAPAITISYSDRDVGWYAYAVTSDNMTECPIYVIRRNVVNLTPEQMQLLIDHEVGHCLGMDHIEDLGIMNARGWDSLSEWDIAEFYRVHPRPILPYRAVVGGVAHD